MARQLIEEAVAIINASPTPTPTPGGTKAPTKPPINRASAPPKTPTPAAKKQVEGIDFVYGGDGEIYTPADPEFPEYVKLWRAKMNINQPTPRIN